MRVLVTGGAGFIGSNLSLTLEELGHEVVVVDGFQSAKQSNLNTFRGQVLQADVSEPVDLPGHFDVIFHQAAITDPRHGNDNEVYQKNVTGFERMIELATKNSAKLIYASTAGLYGNGPVPMQENQEKEILTPYGRSKLKMDEIASNLKGMHVVGLRYFNVFGPREAHKGRPASMIYHLWKQMKEGHAPKIFKFGEHVRDFVYVKDVVRANTCALDGEPGVYNVGTGVGTSFNELVSVLNQVLNTKFEPIYIEMPFDGKTYQSNTIADTRQAESKLKFRSIWNFEKAVRDYIQWLENNGA